jgi:NAD(P)H-dependent FMN reductase
MNIVVISASTRQERKSHQVALEVLNRISKRDTINSTLIDIKELNLPNLDYVYKNHPSPTEQMKNFSEILSKSDGIIIVSPEHNGSYTGALKNTLDFFFGEFSKKVFGVVSVTTGKLGGIRAAMELQKLILVLGGYTLPRYMTTPEVQNVFKEGKLVDESYEKRLESFLDEFLWLTEAIKNQKQKAA